MSSHGFQSAAVVAMMVGLIASPPLQAQAPVPIGSEFQVNTYTTNSQDSPSVASAADGAFVVVWRSRYQTTNLYDVFGQRYDPSGSPAGGEFRVNSRSYPPYPNLIDHLGSASDSDGNFAVVWSWGAAGAGGVRLARFNASGVPLGEGSIIGEIGGPPTAIAANEMGEFEVVWDSYFNIPGDVRGLSVQGLLVNTYTTGRQWMADVALDSDGDFVVVWTSEDQDGDRTGIFGQRFDTAGIALGEEFQINTYTTGDQDLPAVASDSEGNFVVVWQSGYPGFQGVVGQRYDSGGNPLGGEFSVSTSSGEPKVSSDPAGNFVVIWSGAGRAFDSNGVPQGSEFSVPYSQAVASDDDGNFVVVGTASDGSGDGIFGQRFTGPGLYLGTDGSCPGEVAVTILNAPPNTEVAVVGAANTNGWTKGGTTCSGTQFEIGEPFKLPPTWIITDGNGAGMATITLESNRFCWLQALALANCETSRTVLVPLM